MVWRSTDCGQSFQFLSDYQDKSIPTDLIHANM
jgi:hypothetical protein